MRGTWRPRCIFFHVTRTENTVQACGVFWWFWGRSLLYQDAFFARDKPDLQTAWFSISGRRHHADDGSVSVGYTSRIASDRWCETMWIRATLCGLMLARRSWRSFHCFFVLFLATNTHRPLFVHELVLSHGADGVKERMWVQRGAAVSKISMKEILPSFGAHKRK